MAKFHEIPLSTDLSTQFLTLDDSEQSVVGTKHFENLTSKNIETITICSTETGCENVRKVFRYKAFAIPSDEEINKLKNPTINDISNIELSIFLDDKFNTAKQLLENTAYVYNEIQKKNKELTSDENAIYNPDFESGLTDFAHNGNNLGNVHKSKLYSRNGNNYYNFGSIKTVQGNLIVVDNLAIKFPLWVENRNIQIDDPNHYLSVNNCFPKDLGLPIDVIKITNSSLDYDITIDDEIENLNDDEKIEFLKKTTTDNPCIALTYDNIGPCEITKTGVAIGLRNKNYNVYGTSFGRQNRTTGKYSNTIGSYLNSNAYYGSVFGYANEIIRNPNNNNEYDWYSFQIGNGNYTGTFTNFDNEFAPSTNGRKTRSGDRRHNAVEISQIRGGNSTIKVDSSKIVLSDADVIANDPHRFFDSRNNVIGKYIDTVAQINNNKENIYGLDINFSRINISCEPAAFENPTPNNDASFTTNPIDVMYINGNPISYWLDEYMKRWTQTQHNIQFDTTDDILTQLEEKYKDVPVYFEFDQTKIQNNTKVSLYANPFKNKYHPLANNTDNGLKLQYQLDGYSNSGTWNDVTWQTQNENAQYKNVSTEKITIPSGTKRIYFRKKPTDNEQPETIQIFGVKNDNANDSDFGSTIRFVIENTSNVKVGGNINFLAISNGQANELPKQCFPRIFENCNAISDASELYMPAKIVGRSCYIGLFKRCTSLENPPLILPIEEFKDNYGCFSMFENCSKLKSPPIMPKVAQNGSFKNMFLNCTSLKKCPSLPAKRLYDFCYESMFKGCTSIKKTPYIFANPTNSSYLSMFEGCTNLKEINISEHIRLNTKAYYKMFFDCTSLTEFPRLSFDLLRTFYMNSSLGSNGWNQINCALTYMFANTGIQRPEGIDEVIKVNDRVEDIKLIFNDTNYKKQYNNTYKDDNNKILNIGLFDSTYNQKEDEIIKVMVICSNGEITLTRDNVGRCTIDE